MSSSLTAAVPWLLGALLFVWLWRSAARLGETKLGRGAEKAPLGEPVLAPPDEIPACVVPFVLDPESPEDDAMPEAVAGALFELVRRGHVGLVERNGSVMFVAGPEPDQMRPFLERSLHERVRSAGAGSPASAESLRRALEQPGVMAEWSKTSSSWYTERHGELTDPRPERAILLPKMGAQLTGGLFVGIPFWVVSDGEDISGVVAASFLLAGAWLLVSGYLFGRLGVRWRANELDKARRWRAFRGALRQGAPARRLDRWDEDLAFAYALGVGREYVTALAGAAPAARSGMTFEDGQVSAIASADAVEAVTRKLQSL